MVEEQESTAAEFTELPVLRHERIWGFWQFSSVNVGLAIATWAFLTGGTIALFAGVKTAIAATVIGNLVGASLVALSTCLPSAKYGVEQYTALRSVFGLNGVRILIAVMMPLLGAGWNAVLAIMFGRAVTHVLNATLGTAYDPNSPMVIGMSLLALAIAWLTLVRGPVSIAWINKIVAPLLAVVTVVMLVLLLTSHGAELGNAQPLRDFGDDQLNFALALELSFATGFTWWTMMGNLARLTTSPRAAFWPNLLGIFLASALAGLVGTLAALVLDAVDPTVWMIPLGGVALGAVGLLFIAFANVTSMVSQTYSGGLALIRAIGGGARRIPWPVFVALLYAPSVVVVFWPGLLYDHFTSFIAWVGMVMAPLTAVYLADYYLLRHRRLWLRDLYEPEGTSRYTFWWGINPAAFLAVAAGTVTYYLLLNPVTFAAAPIFPYTTAAMPALLVTGTVHVLLTLSWVRPAGKGGYHTNTRRETSTQQTHTPTPTRELT